MPESYQRDGRRYTLPDQLDAQQKAAYEEIMGRLGELMREKHLIETYAIRPTGVILPKRLNHPYTGDDATTDPAKLMGLPVTWSDNEEWGLIRHIAKER